MFIVAVTGTTSDRSCEVSVTTGPCGARPGRRAHDREARSRAFVLQCAVAVLLLVFGLVGDPVSILVSSFLASKCFMQTGVAVLYTDIAEVFPLALRGLGSGIANGTGCLAGVLGGCWWPPSSRGSA